MAINTKLELRQTHSLVMTPQLQQAIKLLQLSNLELASFVDAELERNPLLERAESEEAGGAAGDPPTAASKSEDQGDSDVGSGETSSADEGEPSEREDFVDLEAPSAGGTLRLRVRIAMGYRRGNLELALISRI